MSDRSEQSRSSAQKGRGKDSTARFERPKMDHWSPSNALELPPEKDGYLYRWIAEYVNGQYTPRNVGNAIREGYERVSIGELPDDFIVDEDNGDGYARTGGLILMKWPVEFAQQRQEYYAQRSQQSLHGANVLQGLAGKDAVEEDRGTRTLSGREAGAALREMSSQ